MTISTAALSKLKEWKRIHDKRHGYASVLGILWIDSSENPGFPSVPAIGYYDPKDEIGADIHVIGGLQIVFVVPERYRMKLEGKTLDVGSDGLFVHD